MNSPSSQGSSSGESNKDDVCAICLGHFDSDIGSPELCDHYFCLECIVEWSKNNNSCPQDRIPFFQIFVRKTVGGKIFRKIPIEEVSLPDVPTEINEDITFCQICGRCDREDVLLLCDGCDDGYHLDCLIPALESVPLEEWFCHSCLPERSQNQVDNVPLSDRVRSPPTRRLLPRTQESERIRARINRARRSNANILDIHEVASTPSTSGGRRSTGTTTTKKKRKRVQIRKKRRPVKKRKTTKGKSRKGSKKKVTKKRAKLSTIRRKTNSAKARLADVLGLVIAKNKHNPSQQLIKIKKPSEAALAVKNAAVSNYTYGFPTLSLLGSNSELDTVEMDEYGDSLLTAAVRRNRDVDSHTAMLRRKAASMAFRQARAARPSIHHLTPTDMPQTSGILDMLIDTQTALHSKSASTQIMRKPVIDRPNLNCEEKMRKSGTGADENHHKNGSPQKSPSAEQSSFSGRSDVQFKPNVNTASSTGRESRDPTGAQAYLSYLKECNSKGPPSGIPENKPKKKKRKNVLPVDDDVDLYSDIEPEPGEDFSGDESMDETPHPGSNSVPHQSREESPVSSAEELFIDEKPADNSTVPPILSAMKPSDFEAVSDNDTQDDVDPEPSPSGSISLSDSNETENQVTSTTFEETLHRPKSKTMASIGLDRLETEVISDTEELCFADTEVIEEGEIPTEVPKVPDESSFKGGLNSSMTSSKGVAKASEGDYEEGEIVDDKKTAAPVMVEPVQPAIPPEPIIVPPVVEPPVTDHVKFAPIVPSPTRSIEAPKDPPPLNKVDISFKKMSKNLKVRNYRDSDKTIPKRSPNKKTADHDSKFHDRSKNRSSRKSKRRKSKTRDREPKRKEMERYSVREMITKKEEERKKKDEFGGGVSLRDVIKSRKSSRRSRSVSRKRSRSHSRSKSSRKRVSGGRSSSYRSRQPQKRRRRSRSSSLSYSSSSSSCSSCSSSDSRSSSSTPRKPDLDKDRNHRNDRDHTPIKNSITYSEKPTGKQKSKVKVVKLESDKKRKKKKLPVQSKEVFQAGGSIMVSVNFSKNEKAKESAKKDDVIAPTSNKPNHSTAQQDNSAPWANGRSSPGKRTPLQDEPMWSPENESHLMNDPDPVDLDIIMVTPPPQEPILISDSEDEQITLLPPDLGKTSSSLAHKNQGPKTPPEPAVKFTLSTKQNLKAICNPLGDEEPTEEPVPTRGPNTPPGPPPESDESYGRPKSPSAAHRSNRNAAFSPQPDVYDPFDPTKSPSNSPQEAKITSSDQVDTIDPSDASSETEHSPTPPPLPANPPQIPERPPEPHKPPPEPEVKVIKTIESKVTSATPIGANLVSSTNHAKKTLPPKPIQQVPVAVPMDPALPLAVDPSMQQLFARLPPNVASILYPAAIAAATARQSAANLLLQRPAFPIAPADFSKPPPAFTPLANKTDHNVTPKRKGMDGMDMDASSPTSPASSDASDIFEPPATLGVSEKTGDAPKHKTKSSKAPAGDRFDALLDTSQSMVKSSKSKPSKSRTRTKEPPARTDPEEDIPSSAVDLQVQEKLIKKMQRQERVVDEVKLSLKPYYNKKTITKNDYKDIMKKCVQKVCHNRSGEINPVKIRALVEGYIKKVKYYHRKKNSSPKASSKSQSKSHKVSGQGLS